MRCDEMCQIHSGVGAPGVCEAGASASSSGSWRFGPVAARQMGEVSTFDLASAVGSVRGKCADAVGRRDRSGRVVPAASSKRPDQGPREKHGAWMLARLCGNAQSASVFTCTADNRIRESRHLTLIHDRTNLSCGRSRRPGLFDRAPLIRLPQLWPGHTVQRWGKKKFWDTQCMCDVLCCVVLH